MSQETSQWLNNNVLIGYTAKRGTAWHYRASEQGDEPNHYDGPIPIEDVRRRLFNWEAIETYAPRFPLPGGAEVVDPTRKGIVRSDTRAVLGVFKKGYTIHGYSDWLITNVEAILDASLAVGSAGLLKGGAVAWVQVEMEDTMKAADVEFRPFLTASTSLDGSLATTYGQGAQVVVCDNTLQMANEKLTSQIKFKHSSKSLGRIEDVREALKLVIGTGEAYAAEIERLATRRVSEKLWGDFVKAFTAPTGGRTGDSKGAKTKQDNKIATLNGLWTNDERVTPWKGTEYGVLAAVNTYQHHEARITKGRSLAERNAEWTVTGQWAKHDGKALQLLASLR